MRVASRLISCCAACACDVCRIVVSRVSRRSARIAYCGLFGLSLMVSWIFRGVNHFHQTPNREWFETDAVLQVSMANIIFFTNLALMMMGVKQWRDPQDGRKYSMVAAHHSIC